MHRSTRRLAAVLSAGAVALLGAGCEEDVPADDGVIEPTGPLDEPLVPTETEAPPP